jgi:hypothetical protein
LRVEVVPDQEPLPERVDGIAKHDGRHGLIFDFLRAPVLGRVRGASVLV